MTAERKKLVEEIAVVAARVADLIRLQNDTSIKIKKSEWTVGDALAHLVISQIVSRQVLQGKKNPYRNAHKETVAAMNAQLLEEFTERDGRKLATLLIIETDNLLKEISRHNDTALVKTHLEKMDVMTCISYNLCHLLIHGSAVAKTLNKPLPLEEKHVAMVLPFLKHAMLTIFDKELAKDFQGIVAIHLENVTQFAMYFDNGSLRIEEKIPKHVDCHIFIDPQTYFLVATRVTGQWQPFIRGRIKLRGSKPWLALSLPKYFKTL